MDRISSRDSNSPTANGIPEKPPFKLCFSRSQLLGKSCVRSLKMNGDSIAPKFYSKQYESYDPPRSDALENVSPLERKKPKDNGYPCRLLTSHAYGWWHEQGIRPIDSQFNFRKTTSDLVHFQMKLYAEDQKLGISKH